MQYIVVVVIIIINIIIIIINIIMISIFIYNPLWEKQNVHKIAEAIPANTIVLTETWWISRFLLNNNYWKKW